MAIAFVGAGSGTERLTTGTSTASKTTCTAGNLIVCHLHSLGTDWSGWSNPINISDLVGATSSLTTLRTDANDQIKVGRATADGTCSADFTVGASGDDVATRIYEFSGLLISGTTTAALFENGGSQYGGNTATNTSVEPADCQTNGTNRLAANFASLHSAQTIGSFTGESGGDWTEAVAEYVGTTLTLQLQTAVMAAAGTITGGSFTVGVSTLWLSISTGLIPEPPPAGGGSTQPGRMLLLGVG